MVVNRENTVISGWTARIEAGSSSKHQGIFNAIVADISSGRLRTGDRLPPQRAVAAALGVDLTTVTKAYNKARAEGIIQATTGRGSFVSMGMLAEPARDVTSGLLDLSKNSPPRTQNPDIGRAIIKELEQSFFKDLDTSALNYQDTGGSWANRAAGAAFLGRRMAQCETDRVVLTSGAQSAIYAVCHLLCKVNKSVAVGQFSYPGIHTVAFQQGLHLVPLAMDGEGILTEAFEEACRQSTLAALYITPTIDNPTTATLSPARRQQIVAIAVRNNIPIIEDDPYSELLAEPPAPLASYAANNTWHIATLSKCLTPALRLGYVLTPSPEASRQLAAALQAMTMMASPLFAALASRWIYSGYAQEVAAAIRSENAARQAVAAGIFAGQRFASNSAAPHFWLSLPNPWRAIDFVHQAERRGVITLASSSFATTSPGSEAVRISLGGASSMPQLENALMLLQGVITGSQPNTTRAMV